jgi:23S rRNA A1618 N6-methylase RlmF
VRLKHSAIIIVAVMALVGFGSYGAQAQSADISEEFDLNIAERRITETNFERSLRARLEGENVRLLVGVSAEAERIDVTIRGVAGHVRFRASIERIRQRIARLRSVTNSR